MKYKIVTFIVLLFIVTKAGAQNATNIPTSMYGIGELSMADGGKYSGIGAAGIGLNKKGFINTQNPACITSLDTTSFVYDFGLTSSFSKYSMQGETSSAWTGNPNRITLGVRLMPKWYTVVGVAPFSSVGYMIKSTQEVEGTSGVTLSSLFEGNGGLYRLYLTNAFILAKGLSLGTNIGMISGNVEETETDEGAIITQKSKKSAFYADFGLHYAFTKTMSAGLTYGLPTDINQNNTLSYDNSSIDEDLELVAHKDKQYIPKRVGLGLTFDNKKWTFTGDYSWIQWSRNKSSLTNVEFIDQHKANLGFIYNTDVRKPRSVELMSGIGLSNSYMVYRKGKMYNFDFNAGVAIPLSQSVLSLGFSWRKQLNSKSNLMQEDRLSFNLNMTFGERRSNSKIY